MSNKKRILCWMDSPFVGTGFGIVARYILSTLYATGKYEIHQLAINHHGEFHDENQYPWQIQPAKLLDPKDPHGMKMFCKTLMKNHYDYVLVLNDLFVTHKVAKVVNEAKQLAVTKRKRPPIFIYYYPVDCQVTKHTSDFLDACDVPVCYNQYGKQETLKVKPELKDKLVVIPHGIDTNIFFPSVEENIKKWRRNLFNINEDTTLILNVNRNSTRKQIPYSMLAFKEFRKQVPNSKMYIHTVLKDQGGDLGRAVEDLGFNMVDDIVFPVKFSPNNPAPDGAMHQIYNCADIFLTTHLGEGHGLVQTEAMACGLPLVAPDNTNTSELLGSNSKRGYMYECKDTLYIDASGYRKKGLIPDIVDKMMEAYNDGSKFTNPKCHEAAQWCRSYDWNIVNKKWVDLFNKIEMSGSDNDISTILEEI